MARHKARRCRPRVQDKTDARLAIGPIEINFSHVFMRICVVVAVCFTRCRSNKTVFTYVLV